MSLLFSPTTFISFPPYHYHCFLSPPTIVVVDNSYSCHHSYRLVSAAAAHSNPKILKPNRRSKYGEALSVYDDEEEEEDHNDGLSYANVNGHANGVNGNANEVNVNANEVNGHPAEVNGSVNGVNGIAYDDGGDDGDDIPWFNDDEDEFAEPSNLYRGQQRSKLLDATKSRPGNRRKSNTVGGKAGGKGKLKKYAQLSEEFRLDNRWIPLLDYLSTFGMKESHFIQMHRRHMNAFHINVYSARERLDYLMDIGVKHKDIKKILSRQPQILEYTVDSNMKPRVAFLLSLGIPDTKIGQVITTTPSIFSYSVENSLKPTVRYLIEEVGIKESELGKVVTLSPQILVQRVDISWNDRYDFLSEELGAPKESVVKMVTKHPQLLHYSIEDGLLPRINFLRSIGMNNSDILKVLTSITQVFSLSLEANLRPKYMYLVNELQNEVQSLTKYPMYLSLSLEQRIRPRHRFLLFLNRVPEGPFPLSSLVPTDESFCQQWARTTVDQYLDFRQNMMLKEFAKKYEKQ